MSVGLFEALAPYGDIFLLLIFLILNLLVILSGPIFICLLSGNSRWLACQRIFGRAPESLIYGQGELHALDILLGLHDGLFASGATLRRGRERQRRSPPDAAVIARHAASVYMRLISLRSGIHIII